MEEIRGCRRIDNIRDSIGEYGVLHEETTALQQRSIEAYGVLRDGAFVGADMFT